ncbi:MAG: thiol reductase thioredoxin [Legionellales bacterium]|nr:thiol reductase thioredoxin [Legionellales bacterium]
MNLVTLTADNFEQVLGQKDLTVIDFWAQWCQPCLTFADTFVQVAKRFPDITFAKVDVEAETELAADFSVRSIPLLVILKQRTIVFAESGSLPESTLIELIEQAQALDLNAVSEQGDRD